MADVYLAGLLNKYQVGEIRVRAVAGQIIYPGQTCTTSSITVSTARDLQEAQVGRRGPHRYSV